MQLRRLAALEQQKINDEKKELEAEIARLETILSSEANIKDVIRRETREVAAKFGDKRRTQIALDTSDLSTEDLIEDKNVLVSITTANYIKRIDLDTYRKQRRGGHGITGMTTKEEDLVGLGLCCRHEGLPPLLHEHRPGILAQGVPDPRELPRCQGQTDRQPPQLKGRGRHDRYPDPEFRADRNLLFATRLGQAIKIPLDQFSNPRSTGTNAIKLKEKDQLVDVILTDGTKELILTTRFGQSLRFHEETVRTVGRNAQGVRGMKLRGEDTIVAVTLLEKDHLLTISDVGFGKRSEFDEFRGHGRGTMGVRNMQLERDAVVIESRAVCDTDEIIAMTASGVVIRMPVSEFRIIGRGTKGVRVMRLDEKDKVIGVAFVSAEMITGDGQEPDNENGAGPETQKPGDDRESASAPPENAENQG